jgi:glycosyltransferase involved in cell wall biosynthesis
MTNVADKVHILLCGYYFQGNTGDDLMMESIVKSLGKYGEIKVTFSFNRDEIDWCDILLIGGGTHTRPWNIGGYEHARYAKEKGKKIVYYAQTIEDGHPLFEEHMRHADFITVRDSESKRVVERHGFRAILTSDPVFVKRRRTIGFSLRKWLTEPPGVTERFASVLDDLSKDYDIVSIPYTFNQTDTESDLSYHDKIIQFMKCKPTHIGYDEIINSIDLLIGMRLHAIITAVNVGKKVLAIDYDSKVGRILSDLDLKDMIVFYDDVERIPDIIRNKIFRVDGLAQRGKVNEALIAKICADIKGEPSLKVSVVMYTRNRAQYLKKAIDSIIDQTIQDWELIIIDDGSTDDTREQVQSYNDKRIKYYDFGYNGIGFSRNIGNLLSRGEIILVADSDYINLPNRLEVACKEMEQNGADIIYSSMFCLDSDRKKKIVSGQPFLYEKLRESNLLYHPTVAYRLEVAMKCPYNENREVLEDYCYMYLQAADMGYRFHYIKEPLVVRQLNDGQSLSSQSSQILEAEKVVRTTCQYNIPMVSIIIPTCDRPGFLKEALQSVISQTYKNLEIIIINDGGEDVSEIINSLDNKGNIIYLRHEDRMGPSAARNTGLKVARGKYIAYLDDDDVYYPNHLETLIVFLERSNSKVAYTDSYQAFQAWITDRYVTTDKTITYSYDFDRQKFLISNYIHIINIVHRRELLDEIGLFDEELETHEDWDMCIRLSQKYEFYHIKDVTAEFRTRDDMSSATSIKRADFLRTLRLIHKRYSHLVTDLNILEAQKKLEKSLAMEVEIRQASSSISQYENLHRYRFAKEFVKGKRVLVLVSGNGYGGFILSEDAESVTCIEKNASNVRHASSNYIKENLEFIKGSITDVPIKEEKIFEVIICFEVLEHIKEHDELMKEVKRLLKDGGIFIASAPNKYMYSDQPSYQPPFHLTELSFDEFKTLLNNNFKNTLIYGQKVYPSSNIFPLFDTSGPQRDYVVQKAENGFLFVPPMNKSATYLIAIASDGPLTTVTGNSYLIDVSETLIRHKDVHIGNLEAMVQEKDVHIGNLEAMVKEKDVHIDNLEAMVKEKDVHIDNLEAMVKEKDSYINQIHSGHGWRLLTKYYSTIDTLLPEGSRRKKLVRLILRSPRLVNKSNLNKSVYYIKNYGFRGFLQKAKHTLKKDYMVINSGQTRGPENPYQLWIEKNEPKENELRKQKETKFSYEPKISIIIPTFNTPKQFLIDMIESVRSQTYPNWELCLADGGSTEPQVKEILEAYANKHTKIKLKFLSENKGIAGNSNEALSLATGDFITLLGHDDTLAPFALFAVVKAINEDTHIDFLYSDEDKITEDGRTRLDPHFKPDWSPDTLRSYNYVGNLLVSSRSLLEEIGYFRDGYEGSETYDLIVRATEKAKVIIHIPKILYHGRMKPACLTAGPFFTKNATELREIIFSPAPYNLISSSKKKDDKIKFSLIILNKNAPEFIVPLIESLRTPELNNYYEVIIGDTGTTDEEVLEYYQSVSSSIKIIRALRYHFSNNYNYLISKQACGKLVGMMNNDIIIKDTSFLHRVERVFLDNRVSIAGTKLLYPDGRLQHGGVFFMEKGEHRGLPYHRLHRGDPTKLSEIDVEFVPAVTGAFLFCRREQFLFMGGLDEVYEEEAQDVDFCLRWRRMGKEVAFINLDGIIHIENGTRKKGSENWKDRDYFLWKWSSFLDAVILGSELNKNKLG